MKKNSIKLWLDSFSDLYEPTEYEKLQAELLRLEQKEEIRRMRARVEALKFELGEFE